ncbi:hypothetical protein BRADI_1g41975v3 [Brachypodium distachyon]|uniref:Uncharacterized protein n=1 Tax=Brachypodium distachyon TaxID=15368 RepID=A0A2K2DNT2_BRADI|nr:hypothetical protein BRADI_1g41975v3 [Brachypodium distachyon]
MTIYFRYGCWTRRPLLSRSWPAKDPPDAFACPLLQSTMKKN